MMLMILTEFKTYFEFQNRFNEYLRNESEEKQNILGILIGSEYWEARKWNPCKTLSWNALKMIYRRWYMTSLRFCLTRDERFLLHIFIVISSIKNVLLFPESKQGIKVSEISFFAHSFFCHPFLIQSKLSS